MSAPSFPSAAWTGTSNVTTFREQYIRDLVDDVTVPHVYASAYNRATKAQFFADTAIDDIKTRCETDFAEELGNVYLCKYAERITYGDSDATADAMANTVLLDSTMRLVRSYCRESMMVDPGFVNSIADTDQRSALFTAWASEIKRDRQFEAGRSGSFASIPLVRL